MPNEPLTNAELAEIAAQVLRGERPQSDLEKYNISIGEPEEMSLEELLRLAAEEEEAGT